MHFQEKKNDIESYILILEMQITYVSNSGFKSEKVLGIALIIYLFKLLQTVLFKCNMCFDQDVKF